MEKLNMHLEDIENERCLAEEHRKGNIKTNYALIKASFVSLYLRGLAKRGHKKGVDYFVLGEGKYRQIHVIQK